MSGGLLSNSCCCCCCCLVMPQCLTASGRCSLLPPGALTLAQMTHPSTRYMTLLITVMTTTARQASVTSKKGQLIEVSLISQALPQARLRVQYSNHGAATPSNAHNNSTVLLLMSVIDLHDTVNITVPDVIFLCHPFGSNFPVAA